MFQAITISRADELRQHNKHLKSKYIGLSCVNDREVAMKSGGKAGFYGFRRPALFAFNFNSLLLFLGRQKEI